MANTDKSQDVTLPAWPGEGRPAGAPELDPQQCEAAKNAHKLFVKMANRPYVEEKDDRPELSFLPRISDYRRSHAVLIDGSRGSGKTAVMLRLVKDWGDKFTAKLTDPSAVATPLDQFKLNPGVVLVPVGILDLEAVPQTANLATRLAGMFERVVSALSSLQSPACCLLRSSSGSSTVATASASRTS